LLRSLDAGGDVRVLMQHRAPWTHDGDTWGIPGGARDSHESPPEAAVREAGEEAGIVPADVRVREVQRDDHGGWVYDTVIAEATRAVDPVANAESAELRWVREPDVGLLALHPGFARSWPLLRARPVTVVIDAANVVGSRPDGWWKDRVGATRRLLQGVESLRGRVTRHEGAWIVLARAELVTEGAARGIPSGRWARVVDAAASGDDTVVARTGMLVDALVVTADRGLRARLGSGAAVAGPRWLLDLLP
jgi:8-oxo-dGTP diphosphatase